MPSGGDFSNEVICRTPRGRDAMPVISFQREAPALRPVSTAAAQISASMGAGWLPKNVYPRSHPALALPVGHVACVDSR